VSRLFKAFPDNDSARLFLEAARWPEGQVCPRCKEAKRICSRKNGYYRCNACVTDFTVRTGTPFQKSKVPLNKWIEAIVLQEAAQTRLTSVELAKRIGVTQKTAWLMLKRLRDWG
jgi:transposase-like protein